MTPKMFVLRASLSLGTRHFVASRIGTRLRDAGVATYKIDHWSNGISIIAAEVDDATEAAIRAEFPRNTYS